MAPRRLSRSLLRAAPLIISLTLERESLHSALLNWPPVIPLPLPLPFPNRDFHMVNLTALSLSFNPRVVSVLGLE